MTPEQKEHIDNMSYEEMLRSVRFDPVGNEVFSGTEICTYFIDAIKKRRMEIGPVNHAAASKAVGWG